MSESCEVTISPSEQRQLTSKAEPDTKDSDMTVSRWRSCLPLLLVLLVGSLLACSLIVGKLAINAGAAPLAFLCLALLGSGLGLWLLSIIRRQAARLSLRVLEYGMVAGLLFLLPNIVGFLAVRYVGAGFISMTFLFPLLITYCLALIAGLERFSLLLALAVLIGLAGGVLLAASKASLGDAPLIWIILTLCGPFVIAAGNLYRTLRWPYGVAPLFLASQMLLMAGLMLLPLVLVVEGGNGFLSAITDGAVVILVWQMLTFSSLYFFYFILQKVAGPVYLSQIGSVAAVVGAGVASFGLGEQLPPNLGLAAFLVAIGVFLFQRAAARKREDVG
ncbi:DMT family transporter [Cohaesibacter intestini]|uniref:DMT family transporter n=1 Tax=Cohaesibacter intestini TaxID=2211145 RepID=UPI0018E5517E|nr:DMT family transporter [Cohaesibacter intestini]